MLPVLLCSNNQLCRRCLVCVCR